MSQAVGEFPPRSYLGGDPGRHLARRLLRTSRCFRGFQLTCCSMTVVGRLSRAREGWDECSEAPLQSLKLAQRHLCIAKPCLLSPQHRRRNDPFAALLRGAPANRPVRERCRRYTVFVRAQTSWPVLNRHSAVRRPTLEVVSGSRATSHKCSA